MIRQLSNSQDHLVFILWGNYAIAKSVLIDTDKHVILSSPHPSPFSAHKGFFGSKCFSKVNTVLKKWGKEEVKWG